MPTVDIILTAEQDDELTDRMTRRLRAELLDLDVESADLQPAVAPPDSKAADPVTIGAIIVALGAGSVPALIGLVRDWLTRQPHPVEVTVTLDGDTLSLKNPTTEQQQALVDSFLHRHPSS
jgi:hypothetical protein